MQRVGIDNLLHGSHGIALLLLAYGSHVVARVLHLPQAVVQSHLGLHRMRTAHPVECLALDLTVGTGQTAAGLGIVGAVDSGHAALGILVARVLLVTLDDVGVLQSHLLAWSQAHELLLGHLLEVAALNPELAAKLDGVCAVGLVLRIIDGRELLHLSFGIVGDDHLHRVEHSRNADGTCIQIVAHHALQQCHVVQCIKLGVTYLVDELHNTFGRVATTAEATDGGHARIVPSAYHTVLHECQQVALRHERVVQVQLVELRLSGTLISLPCYSSPLGGRMGGHFHPFLHPAYEQVVEGTVLHKLQRTPRVGHALQIVALSVGEVIHGVCVPLRTRLHVRNVQHAIE